MVVDYHNGERQDNGRTQQGREEGIQVPAWVKLCIHPVPFFPDVVLRVCNIAVICVALSMFLQRTVGEFICPYPRSWQK